MRKVPVEPSDHKGKAREVLSPEVRREVQFWLWCSVGETPKSQGNVSEAIRNQGDCNRRPQTAREV